MARPKGAKDKRLRQTPARKLAAQAAAEGITPLEVMLRVMRAHFEAGDMEKAAKVAADAAPYLHPRLASTEARVTADVAVTEGVDRPPRETRDEWIARRYRELGIRSALMGPPAGTAD